MARLATLVLVAAAIAATVHCGVVDTLRNDVVKGAHKIAGALQNTPVPPRRDYCSSTSSNFAVLFRSGDACQSFSDYPLLAGNVGTGWNNCTVGSYCMAFGHTFATLLDGQPIAGLVGWGLQTATFVFDSSMACQSVWNATFAQGSYIHAGCTDNVMKIETSYGFEFTQLLDGHNIISVALTRN